MQLKYWKNIAPAVDGMQKVSSLAWSPNGKRLAVSSADRGEKKDKFPTKASEKGIKSYVIRALEFSPDSQKLCIAQSDNIVFIYKIGLEWGDKKTICNKFPGSSSITALTWPKNRHGEIVFGLAEGKVKIGYLKNNKSTVLYNTDSYVVALASNRDGSSIISGHLDGTIISHNIDSQQTQKIKQHHSVPYALAWGEQIVAGGNDAKVSFYDVSGNTLQRFDYTNDEKVRDFTVAAVNPSGDTIVLGNYNRFYIYNFNKRRGQWEEIGVKNIENYYTVTAMGWKHDGSKLTTGSLCGSVDGFDVSLRKVIYKGKFEINYVSPAQVVVKTLSSGSRCVIKSDLSSEISRINILQDRFVIGNSQNSLILADLETNKSSEISWRGAGNEKYDFSNPNVCMVFNAGELTLIEFGENEPLGTCRTEYVKPTLVSVRLGSTKAVAYLLDKQTICVQNLQNSVNIAQISNDSAIDFLELSAHANKLLFRDKRRQLYLYNIKTQTRNTLLNYCNYAQWVPDSEVVVAQNRNNMCVWYSIENPDKVTICNIKGDIESIERSAGKTEVIVNEAQNPVAYRLDEPLIEFGFAVETRDLEKAASILDPLEMTGETEANWKILARISLEEENLSCAEHCYAALGDIAKARYLRKINKLIYEIEEKSGQKGVGIRHYKVRAKLAVLEKQFHQAEALLLDNNEVDNVMEMYQELHKWDESIKIAEKTSVPNVKELKNDYFKWLLQTGQEGKAAELKESEGELIEAINLYLKGGLPALAANVVFNYNASFPQDILERIANSLAASNMWERAGEFYEQMDIMQRALDCYCKGNAFSKALELAKRSEPRLVVQLEERWGDWLVSQRQTDNAVNHYIEAGAFQKAIEAAIAARQWPKAVQLLTGQPLEIARPFYRQIAKHYSEIRQHDLAEKYFLKAGLPVDAFEMYVVNGKWEHALRVAKENLPESEVTQLFLKQGQKLESIGHYKEAEKLFITAEQPDFAVNMYKRAGQWDNMVRLVSKYYNGKLKETHLGIAQKLEQEGNLKAAEQHYIDAGAWHGAMEMYRQKGLWEDAIRVCKFNGNDRETSELAKRWAESLGPEMGIKALLKHNLVDAVIEYMIERNEFEDAFRMAQGNARHKVADVHLKYALYLEDERRYKEAEEHFIKAGKPGEAINMYEHSGDFVSALGVARQYDPQLVALVLVRQAKFCYENRDFGKAENCYIQAKKPELAVQMYKEMGNKNEAIRVARKHAPYMLGDLQQEPSGGKTDMSGEELRNHARLFEERREYSRAIDTYLELTKEHFNEKDILEESWERAVQLALNFDKERAQDIVRIVSKRLREIGRFEPAAELLENVGLIEEAVSAYVAGKLFDRANMCIKQIKNPDLFNRLSEYIKKAYRQYLKGSNQAEDLIRNGDVIAGLDIFVENDQWTACLEYAAQAGKEILNRYLMKFAKNTMESGKFGETISAFAKYGIQALPQNYPIYKTLALEIFVECDKEEVFNLRHAFFSLQKSLQTAGEVNTPAGKEFAKYFYISHMLDLKNTFDKKDIAILSAKISISLLRYSDLIRLDKLYYDAGIGSKKQNWLSLAFMLLNRFLDIYEVILEPDSAAALGDNNDYLITDIPSPYDCPLPEKNCINKEEKEVIRDWCLQISIDQKVPQQLPTRNCEYCKKKIYEAAIKCYNCKNSWEPCIITGYPLVKPNVFPCKSCGKGGLKDAWSVYLQNFANCPWCNNIPN